MLPDMKNVTWVITLLSAATLATGCSKPQTTAQQIDKVQTETKQAAQDMKDYTFAQKAEFIAAMQTELAALNQDLEKLSAKIDGSSDDIKAEARPRLQALRDQAAQLNQQLADAAERHGLHLGQRQGRFPKSLRCAGEKLCRCPPVGERQNCALNLFPQ